MKKYKLLELLIDQDIIYEFTFVVEEVKGLKVPLEKFDLQEETALTVFNSTAVALYKNRTFHRENPLPPYKIQSFGDSLLVFSEEVPYFYISQLGDRVVFGLYKEAVKGATSIDKDELIIETANKLNNLQEARLKVKKAKVRGVVYGTLLFSIAFTFLSYQLQFLLFWVPFILGTVYTLTPTVLDYLEESLRTIRRLMREDEETLKEIKKVMKEIKDEKKLEELWRMQNNIRAKWIDYGILRLRLRSYSTLSRLYYLSGDTEEKFYGVLPYEKETVDYEEKADKLLAYKELDSGAYY